MTVTQSTLLPSYERECFSSQVSGVSSLVYGWESFERPRQRVSERGKKEKVKEEGRTGLVLWVVGCQHSRWQVELNIAKGKQG